MSSAAIAAAVTGPACGCCAKSPTRTVRPATARWILRSGQKSTSSRGLGKSGRWPWGPSVFAVRPAAVTSSASGAFAIARRLACRPPNSGAPWEHCASRSSRSHPKRKRFQEMNGRAVSRRLAQRKQCGSHAGWLRRALRRDGISPLRLWYGSSVPHYCRSRILGRGLSLAHRDAPFAGSASGEVSAPGLRCTHQPPEPVPSVSTIGSPPLPALTPWGWIAADGPFQISPR